MREDNEKEMDIRVRRDAANLMLGLGWGALLFLAFLVVGGLIILGMFNEDTNLFGTIVWIIVLLSVFATLPVIAVISLLWSKRFTTSAKEMEERYNNDR